MEITNHEGGKSFILSGPDTKKYKEEIKKLGGKWNSSLVGWIFANRHRENIEAFVKNPERAGELNPPRRETHSDSDSEILERKEMELSRYLKRIETLQREISTLKDRVKNERLV